MNDTPRTDANVKKHKLCQLSGNDLVYANFPRQLERELTAMTEQRDEAREALAELNEEYGTWWAQKRIALDELKDVAEQRDRLIGDMKEIYNISSFDYDTMPEAGRRKYWELILAIADKARKHLISNEP